MQAQPSIASKLGWLGSLFLVVALTVSGVFVLAVITDDEGETGCGGG